MENNEKIYLGSVKEKFQARLVNTTINLSKISKTCKDYIFEYGGDKYIKLKVVKKREGEDEYGKSHYVEVDTWNPASADDKGLRFEPEKKEQPDEELPF